ncbi:branched-chain amino acid ABC transporter permease [Prauserella flavalba]|uniref:branched-chain amino acid ABC transporter permease n=1 Tax=Prauserella flavalba TaxID=1477506 RepID=UPI0036ED6CA8
MIAWYEANVVLIQSTFISLLLALSIQVPFRAGVFSLAGIGSYGIGAYTAAIVTLQLGWPPFAAIGAGMLLAAVIAYLLALVLARLSGLYLGMATIAYSLILSVVVINGGELTGGAQGLFGAVSDLQTGHVVAVAAAAVVLLALSERGRLGRWIDAVREDPELAVSVGVPVTAIRQLSFVVGGLLGACAGAMNTLLRTTVTPEEVGFHLVVLALTMIIVGGSRSWAGALIGAVVFTWLPTVLAFVGEWQTLVYGVVVAVAAIFVPTGILGLAQDFVRRLRRPALPGGRP